MEGWIMGDIRTTTLGGIPFGVNSGRPSNPQPGQPYFNGQENRLELYTQSVGWQNIVAETPGIVSVQGMVLDGNTTNTLVISGSNFTSGAVASIIGTNGVEIVANSTVVNSVAQVTAVFGTISAQYEPYDVKVLNTSNLYGLLPDGIYVNQTPSWNTAAGSLGTFTEGQSVSIQLSATDPEGTSLSYTVTSGALPTGVTLSSSGLISGTLPDISTNTTYSFTVTVSDGANSSVRTFTITSTALTNVTGGTLVTSDPTYFYRIFSTTGSSSLVVSNNNLAVEYLLIGGGGGGGNSYGGGGGGCGGINSGTTTLSPNTYSIVVGAGGGSVTSGSSTTAFGYTAGGGGNGVSSSGSGGNAGSPLTYVGGTGANASWGESGGGGAGGSANGGNGVASSVAGAGGAGSAGYTSWINAISSSMPSAWQTATSSGRIAGGGGGGGARDTNSGVGGSGGGGAGGGLNSSSDQPGIAGVANTGSGGGGSRGAATGGAGGSGLAVIKYLKSAVG
jgi:Putative Ig domain